MSENQNVTQKEKKFSIIVTEPDNFDPLMESKCLTTMDLADKVNQLLSPMFADYEGCFINPPDQTHGYVSVSVFFRATNKTPGEGQIKNLEAINSQTTTINTGNKRSSDAGVLDQIMAMNTRVKGRSFKLTQKTKEGLSDFIPMKEVTEDYWKNNVIEMTDATPYGAMQYVIYVRVDGLDLNRLLKKIYGGVEIDDVTGDKRYIDYMVTLVRPIQSPMAPQTQSPWSIPTAPVPSNFMAIVSRLDNKNLDDLCRSLGMYNYSTGINIVHAR